MAKITVIKELDGHVSLYKHEDGKFYIKWSDAKEGVSFLNDTKIKARAERGIAFELKGKIMKNCKAIYMALQDESLDEYLDNNLKSRKVDMEIDF